MVCKSSKHQLKGPARFRSLDFGERERVPQGVSERDHPRSWLWRPAHPCHLPPSVPVQAVEGALHRRRGMYAGQFVYCGRKASFMAGNVLPLRSISEGAVVCNVERHVGNRGVLACASGDYANVISHNPDSDTSRNRQGRHWLFNSKVDSPSIYIPEAAGTWAVHYKQVASISTKGVGHDGDEETFKEKINEPEKAIVSYYYDQSRGHKEDDEFNDEQLDVVRDESGHPMVKETCRLIGLRHIWNQKLEGELRHLVRSLDPHQVSSVLRSQSDERVAMSFFYWADRQWRYRHSPQIYYTMLELLSKTKLCQSAKRVLRLMIRRRISRRPQDFSHLMISYSRAGKLRSAMRVLTLIQKDGCEPDLSICNTAIHVLIIAGRLEKALRFLDRMQRVGIAPDVITYNCLLKGFCDAKRVEDALKMISEMPLKGCLPDKISYYTVISFLCKEKRVGEVRELLNKMEHESDLFPDQVTYRLLIHVLSKHGHADEALEFLRESEEKNYRVDKIGYSAVVHSFCLGGRIDEAKEMLKQMLAKGYVPDVVTYSALVNGFCRIGKIDQARKMLRHMYKNGCKPNTVTYTSLLNGLCKIGSSLEALEMLNRSEEDWWTPSVVTYSVVIHGLRREGKLKEACDLVMQMLGNGFFPTTVEINLLIHALCREGKVEDAKKFMEDCQSKGCPINVVNFTTVIHGFCQNNDLESALSLLDDMYLTNRHPDVVTYTVVVDALGKKGNFEKANELIKKMLHRGLLPSPVTYRTIIHRYCEKGRVEDLLMLLEKMLVKQEFRAAYNQVIEKLCVFGKLDEAYKVLGKVLRTASKTDANTCHIFMESYMKKGLPLQSYKVACRMFYRNLIPDMKLCQKVSNMLIAAGHSNEGRRLLIKFMERGKTLAQQQ